MKDVADGGFVKIGVMGDAPMIAEMKLRKGFDGSRDAIAADAAEFDKVFRRGDSDQDPASRGQDPAEFGRIHSGVN